MTSETYLLPDPYCTGPTVYKCKIIINQDMSFRTRKQHWIMLVIFNEIMSSEAHTRLVSAYPLALIMVL